MAYKKCLYQKFNIIKKLKPVIYSIVSHGFGKVVGKPTKINFMLLFAGIFPK